MKLNDYLKYATVQLLTHFGTPKGLRQQLKHDHQIQKEPFLIRWFGLLPLSLILLFAKLKNK